MSRYPHYLQKCEVPPEMGSFQKLGPLRIMMGMIPWTCGFWEVLDNVKLIMYMNSQKISMTACNDMDKKSPKLGVSLIVTAQDFFWKSSSKVSTFVPLGQLPIPKWQRKIDGIFLTHLPTNIKLSVEINGYLSVKNADMLFQHNITGVIFKPTLPLITSIWRFALSVGYGQLPWKYSKNLINRGSK